ncbi:Na+/H+-dicarboxylate symporter [Acetoanaerobium pronyense]|uniref:Na+/H+-dicarboxylate symporter n=1 Tax=Acetoanaerobium pronyense TaxID=1482736 RepID=A0ABS4KKY4_9FIRM|nr:dicarboxylate/amino acid:cation symporter [Acetoanaerobium pronyense]MBP2028453.1 Na+/H+-dicarboxylate symporter [Acetoanaerobium pronyense]
MGKKLKLHHKIFIGLFLGIVVGYVLNILGGAEDPIIGGRVMPFLQFLGDFFLRSIRMVVVPLVLFSIIDGVLALGDVKKLRSIGAKTVAFFLGSALIAVSIGLVLANILKPGAGFQMGDISSEVQMKELPGAYQTILDLIPLNPFQSMVEGNMMQVIVFAILFGIAVLMVGEKAKPLVNGVSNLSEAMFKIINIILVIVPYGVFGLMSVAIAQFGLAIFGPVAKFIFVDYLANFIMVAGVYSIFLIFIAKVSPIKFWKQAFESWLIAFSSCTTSAALPVSMRIAPRLGVPKEVSSFVLPLGATANMNGTCIYFGIIVLFAAQLYGIELSITQQIMLAIQATFLSVGAAATPQIGLIISITLLTSMGLPLEATALVAGVYRIIDQAHTSTNASGDLVTSVCIASMEGLLDRDRFNDLNEIPELDHKVSEELA